MFQSECLGVRWPALAAFGVLAFFIPTLTFGAEPPDPSELAKRIDQRLNERFAAENVTPTPQADDAEFFRRLHLDLAGVIPTADTALAFINDSDDNKRELAIDQLLSSPEHTWHFANVWRALLLPEAETDRQIRFFLPGFELWLQQRRAENAGFDTIVRDLLTVPITGTEERPQLVLTNLRNANPIAFIAAKEADPGKLAANTTRLFLGIRLECAQCHNHPFDRWTQEQFWNQAAFFAGIQRKGRGPFAPVLENPDVKSIAIMSDATKMVPAVFLDGTTPPSEETVPSFTLHRALLADWITTPANPYFSKATVNRVWGQLMGYGIVDPVDDFGESNPPNHPELLDELATAFTQSGFDLTYLYQAICSTKAYQRSSQQTESQHSDTTLFAKMAIKPMSGEQFYDSLMTALDRSAASTGHTLSRNEDPVRRKFLDTFGQQGDKNNPETSVLQALTLMNGTLISSATRHDADGLLKKIVSTSPDRAARIESLYLATLSRTPTDTEHLQISQYLDEIANGDRQRHLSDVLWMLLNSAEFRWNH
jgi:hypothetical protein